MNWQTFAPVALGGLTLTLAFLIYRRTRVLAQKQTDLTCIVTAALRKLGRIDAFREAMEDGKLPEKLERRLIEELLAAIATHQPPIERAFSSPRTQDAGPRKR